MKQLLYLLLLSPCIIFGQEDSTFPKLSGDTIFLRCGHKIVKGDKLKLGTGSTDDGDFKFIRISSTSMLHYSSFDNKVANSANALPRANSRHEFKVVI